MSFKNIAILILICAIALSVQHFKLSISNVKDFMASVFFVDSITVDDLHARYANGKIKILIVPGHDNEYSGTEFMGVSEADLTADLGRSIVEFFRKDPHFEVTMTRDQYGYSKLFSDYFASSKDAVLAFEKNQKFQMRSFLKKGEVSTVVGVGHNNAPNLVAYRLYAINKWANDNKIDIVLHVHFNDYRRKAGVAGKYSGFSIYIPESQYSNARATKALVDSVFSSIHAHYQSSNLPAEEDGVILDQELIAIGANNSLDAVGFLVEYGYIYEPKILNVNTRFLTFRTFAEDTYMGVKNFFEQKIMTKK